MTNSEIAKLEWAVVEAAVKLREMECSPVNKKPPYDYKAGLTFFNAGVKFRQATDALIAARQTQENVCGLCDIPYDDCYSNGGHF